MQSGEDMKRWCQKLTVILLGTAVIWGSAMAVQAEPGSGDAWEFQLAPYAWLISLKGDVATLPPLPAVDVDLDFWDDIVDNVNGALMLVGEARKGRYGVILDVVYTDIGGDESTPGPLFSSVELETTSWIVSLGGLYRLIDEESAFLDAVAGLRYWHVETDLKLRGGLAPSQNISYTEDWLDPFVGVKGLTPIGQSRFFLSGVLLLGGFDVGSDFMWDATANLGYQWTERFSTIVGYRYLDVDYDDGDFLYDVALHGPILGLSWRF